MSSYLHEHKQQQEEDEKQHEQRQDDVDVLPAVSPRSSSLFSLLSAEERQPIVELYDTWKQYLHTHSTALSLSTPADEDELSSLLSFLSVHVSTPSPSPHRLPSHLLCAWLLSDGQAWDSSGVIGNFDLLSVRLIRQEYQTLHDMQQAHLFDKYKTTQTYTTQHKTQPVYWCDGWVPIASSPAGHLICVDLSPSLSGHHGQLLLFQHDRLERPVIAQSYMSFLQAVMNSLHAGRYQYDASQRLYINPGSEGFSADWLEGGEAWNERKEQEMKLYDENVMMTLTRGFSK